MLLQIFKELSFFLFPRHPREPKIRAHFFRDEKGAKDKTSFLPFQQKTRCFFRLTLPLFFLHPLSLAGTYISSITLQSTFSFKSGCKDTRLLINSKYLLNNFSNYFFLKRKRTVIQYHEKIKKTDEPPST